MAEQQRHSGKEQFWRRVVKRWRRSLLNVRDFCADNDLSEPSFYAWRRELARRDRQAAASKSRAAFVPVVVQAEEPTTAALAEDTICAIELVLGPRRVQVRPGFDGPTLARVLAVLEGRPC